VLLAFLVKEARKVTKGFQAPLCRDQVEEMGNRAPPGFPGPLDSQATRMELWNVSLDRLGIRVPLEFRGSQGSQARLEKKVRKETAASSVTWKDFVGPPGRRAPREK